MYEQLRTHIAIPHIAINQPLNTVQTTIIYATNNNRICSKYPLYTLRTPTVYADLSCPHIHSQPRNNNKHTRTQRIPNHETIKYIYGRDKSAPTPNGMYTNHSWNGRNTHIYKKNVATTHVATTLNRLTKNNAYLFF